MIELPEHAITLTGPWWYFMLFLPPEYRKDIENRPPGFSWKSFRGPVWVHAAKSNPVDDYYAAVDLAARVGVPPSLIPAYESDALRRRAGCLVGRFTITGLLPPGDSGRRWHMPDRYGFTVEDALVCEPVPCRGLQGFWRVPAATLEQLRRVA